MKRKGKWIWIGLGAMAILLRWGLGNAPQFIENYFSRGLFVFIRKILDAIRFIPIPLVYLLILFLAFALGRGIYKLFKRDHPLKRRFADALLSLGASIGAIIFFFLFLWGFNYARVPIEQQQGLDVQPLSKEELLTALEEERDCIIKLRAEIGSDSVALQQAQLPENLEEKVQNNLRRVLKELGYPYKFNPKVQQLRPKGVLLRFQTLGVYFPWTGECNLDGGLHPLEVPHVIAHELAHGYGIGDEGTCNYLAYLACTTSDDPILQYAGHFEYYSTLAVNYRRYDREAYLQQLRALPPAIKADWNDIIRTHDQYPDIFPKLRRATYDTYLKVQGIEEGIKNYNRVLMLVEAMKRKRSMEKG
ncbi:MAG: DUF3810 domain-containing protein [Bacteroidota bacterium]